MARPEATDREDGGMNGYGGILTLLLAMALTTGCGTDGEGWTPVLESTPPTFLDQELVRALEEVREAREAVPASDAAGAALEQVEDRLEAVVEVYLPLYRAKVEAANAYRYHQLGQGQALERSLDAIEEGVMAVSRAREGELAAEMQHVSELVADARVALEGGPAGAGQQLQRLAEALDDLVTRAGLLL